MKPALTRSLTAATLALALASCGVQTTPAAQPSAPAATLSVTAPGQLEAQAVAASTTLTVGQTRQLTVYVSGQPAQPGQLRWTTTNAAVVSVTQGGLVTARAAGSATVRAALASSPSSYIDFPFVVKAATAPAPAPTPTPAPAPAPAPSPTPGTFAQRVLDLTNAARAQARTCGTTQYAAAAPVTYNAQLAQAAQGHATDMATQNYFSHTSLDGRTMSQRVTATGYPWRTIGENIAAGQTTPEQVVQGWLQSPGHCQNIMNPAFRELGVGYATSSTSTYKHYWVQNFGAR